MCTKNEFTKSRRSTIRTLQTDRHTHTQTDRHTDRRDRTHYNSAFTDAMNAMQ